MWEVVVGVIWRVVVVVSGGLGNLWKGIGAERSLDLSSCNLANATACGMLVG